MKQAMGIYGRIRVWKRCAITGLLLEYGESRNVTLDAGRFQMLKSMTIGHADVAAVINRMTVGTGLSAPATTDTALQTTLDTEPLDSTTEDAGPPPEMSYHRLFLADEANGHLTEFGLLFSNDVLLNRGNLNRGDVTGATAANPVVITYANELKDPVNGETVHIFGVGGMTQINDRDFVIANVNIGSKTFELSGENGTGHSAFTTNGTFVRKIIKTGADVAQIRIDIGAVDAS